MSTESSKQDALGSTNDAKPSDAVTDSNSPAAVATAADAATPATTSSTKSKSKVDFEFLKELGEGSFSTVHLARDRKSGSLFAIKECDKSQILREKKVKYVHLEKRILAEYLNKHPFFVQLCFTFQDEDSLYFGLSYCCNGDLLGYILKSSPFTLEMTRFYIAEIVIALQFMHARNIVHRDLKPENILLDDRWHIKLTDFGTARILGESAGASEDAPTGSSSSSSNSPSAAEGRGATRRRNSFVGTAQYVAPEILQGKEPHIGCDLWALGCILFQMLTQKHLFTGGHEYDIFQKVIRLQYSLPVGFEPSAADLIGKLVRTAPGERLGASEPTGYDQLKADAFFNGISWTQPPLHEQTPPCRNDQQSRD